MEEKVLKELMKESNTNEQMLRLLIRICKDNNIKDIKSEVKKYLRANKKYNID